jgi:hypothetical protein
MFVNESEINLQLYRGPSKAPQAIIFSDWLIYENLFLCNCLAKWSETWWEAHMEGAVLSFLEAEWKVSDRLCPY